MKWRRLRPRLNQNPRHSLGGVCKFRKQKIVEHLDEDKTLSNPQAEQYQILDEPSGHQLRIAAIDLDGYVVDT